MNTDAPITNPYYEQEVGKEAAMFLSNLFHFMEHGGAEIGAGILLAISREFGKSLEWLLTGEEE